MKKGNEPKVTYLVVETEFVVRNKVSNCVAFIQYIKTNTTVET